jgi:lysophospholipase L1-like esterase
MSTWGIGTSQHAFICYNPTTSTFETKNSTDMSTYNGLILFASSYGKVYIPFYPKYLVQLIAPDMSNLNNVLYTKDNPEILGQYPIDIREMVLLGDSLSALDRWVYMLDQYFYIPKRTNLAASGTKMSTDTMLKATRAEITTTTQLTTILSGTNDCGWSIPVGTVQSIGSTYDTSTYAGAYQTCVENLYAKNPNMRIIIIVSPRAWYPAGSDTSNPTYEVTNTKLAPYQQVARDVAKTYGLPCFDTPNVMGVNDKNYSQWTVDNLHFNSFGYEKLGRRLAEFIKTNF